MTYLKRIFVALALLWVSQSQSAQAEFDVKNVESGVVWIENTYTRAVARQVGYPGSTGSGIMVSTDGYIITNFHVVAGAAKIIVQTPDHDEPFIATVVGHEPTVDLALLKIEGDSFQALPLSDSERNRGMDVISMGYPGTSARPGKWPLESTITKGTLSSEFVGPWDAKRFPTAKVKMIQHSAIATPGNSGGPLFDDCERVIGVNTQKANAAEGVYWASGIQESINILDRFEVDYVVDSGGCTGSFISGTRQQLWNPLLYTAVGVSVLCLFVAMFLIGSRSRQPAYPGHDQPAPPNPGDSGGRTPKPMSGRSIAGGITLVANDGRSNARYPIDNRTLKTVDGAVLGRDPSLADVEIRDDQDGVSRRHARLFIVDGALFIEDQNSLNGTSVEGEQLEAFSPKRLRVGDRIGLGTLSFIVKGGSR